MTTFFSFHIDTENEVGDSDEEEETSYQELLRRLIKLEKVRKRGDCTNVSVSTMLLACCFYYAER